MLSLQTTVNISGYSMVFLGFLTGRHPLPSPGYARNGKFDSIPVVQVVPGDILFMRGGDIVPADCYWLEGDPCQVDEADEWCSDVKICQLSQHFPLHSEGSGHHLINERDFLLDIFRRSTSWVFFGTRFLM